MKDLFPVELQNLQDYHFLNYRQHRILLDFLVVDIVLSQDYHHHLLL
jgi:hypothetical protein